MSSRPRSFAPDGYEAYVRIAHSNRDGKPSLEVEERLTELLSAFTTTPGQLYAADEQGNVWWPEDRAWCVVTTNSSRETFVACSATCAEALFADGTLDTMPAMVLDGQVDFRSQDPIPPPPPVDSSVAPWSPHPPDDETASASWYVESLVPWPEPDGSIRVRSFLPAGYEAYVRIDHPDVEGEIPVDVCWRLSDYLPHYTRTPDQVFYAAWEGAYPATRSQFASMPRLVAPHRNYLVFLGDRTGASVELPDDGLVGSPLIINVWWPEDRAWCVETGIDSRWTYVGCSSECAQALLDDEFLKASPASLLDRVDDAGRNAGS